MFNSFMIALQFLTRIPVNFSINYSNQRLGQSILFYPVIGLLISAILIAFISILPPENTALNAALLLSLWVLITGGLHLDGLADCSDAWAGGLNNKDRTLAIMKDPAAGPIAVIILALILLLKWTSLQSLLNHESYIIPIIIAPILGRVSILILMLTSPYVSEKGLGSIMLKHLPKRIAQIIVISFLIPCLWYQPLPTLMALAFIFLIRHLAIQRIQGVTGDVFGASVEIIETSLLVGGVLFYG